MKKNWSIAGRAILVGAWLISSLTGCVNLSSRSNRDSRRNVFIDYWPAAKNDRRLRLVVKDNIDMRGVVTSAGSQFLAENSPPAVSDAPCLAIARARDVKIIGKSNLSEFAIAPSGVNDHFGTPRSPASKSRKLIPGGSSSGSAVAVATGMADVAFGTDTCGSVRVPAACCGVVGLKTTLGLVSVKGVFPIEPKHLDTVGPLGKDVDHVVQGMDLLQNGFSARYQAAVAAKPAATQIRVGRLYLDGTDPRVDKAIDDALARAHFKVVRLDKTFKTEWDRAKRDADTIAAAGAWITDQPYFNKFVGVSLRSKEIMLVGELAYTTAYRSAVQRQPIWRKAVRRVLENVDFIAMPTLQQLAPNIELVDTAAILESRMLSIQNTQSVNLAGNPALAIPVPIDDQNIPVTSLQLVGPRLGEAQLLNAGRLVEASNRGLIDRSKLTKLARKNL